METKETEFTEHLYTPQLAGVSKTTKKMYQKSFQHRLEQQSTSANTSLDMIPQLESKRTSDVNVHLQKQRELAEITLRRASEKFPYGSMFKTPIKEDSSVNESDLMKMSGISNFGQNVQVASTPRSSVRDSLGISAREVAEETRRQSATFDELIHKLKTSDITISEVCREFREKMGCRSSIGNFEDLDSDFFLPAEAVNDKIKADEMSWRREKDIPVEQITDFTQDSENSFKNKVSMGEFFQQRSEDISELIPNGSPEKTGNPVALVETSTASNISERHSKDSLSITEIAKLLSQMNDDNPTKVISYLLKQKSLNKENVSPNKSVKHSISPTSVKNMSTLQTPSLNTTTKSTIISMGNFERESNISPSTKRDKSVSSLRSGSAMSSLPDGKLPIQTTHNQLIWGCVKLGKGATKEFAVRNHSQHRLRLQLTSDMMEFKILKDRNESETLTTLKMMLRPQETRTILVSFCPSAKKAFIGSLSFTPMDSDLQQPKKQKISTYGYGGHAQIDFHNNIVKDPTGKFLLPLGDLTNKTTITKTFICRNSGVLPGFVLASFEPKSVCSFVSVLITPNKFVVKPHQEIIVNVTYSATKEDYKYFQNTASTDILEMGMIKLYTGAEALRGRLKCMANTVIGRNLQVKPIIQDLAQRFQDEDIPGDVMKFAKENVDGIKHLLQEVVVREIVVTVEHDLDATIVPIDDTSMFQTLCQDTYNGSALDAL